MHAPGRPLVAVAGLALLLGGRSALANDIPGINGHMTDPGHILSNGDKTTVEEKLNKIQADTRIDVAGWIADVPESRLDELGLEAYKHWNIGTSWDSGIFFMIPKTGRVHVILDPVKPPELTPAEVARVQDADKPNAPMMDRIDAFAETAGNIVRGKALKPRPEGKTDPARGRLYGYGAAAVLAAAIAMTLRTRKQRATLALKQESPSTA
jgi:hypothetical protein